MQLRDGEERLVERVRLFGDEGWLNAYFDLVKELIQFTELEAHDPRLVLSIPSKSKKLPLTINYRYVLGAFLVKKVKRVGFILGAGCEQAPEFRLKMVDRYHFKPLRNEAILSTPSFLEFHAQPEVEFFEEEWRRAVFLELQRCGSSPYQAYHEPLVYRVAVDPEYRKQIFAQAFSG